MFEAADITAPGAEIIRLSPDCVGCYFPPEPLQSSNRGWGKDPPPPRQKVTVVYFHGNGDQLGWGSVYLGRAFARAGVGFFGVEYPGYGLADGTPSEASVLAASQALLEYLATTKGGKHRGRGGASQGGSQDESGSGEGVAVEKKNDDDDDELGAVVLVGQSIGCCPALELAKQQGTSKLAASKLVLLSPFMDLQAMAGVAFPLLGPVLRACPWVLRDRLDNAAAAPQVALPVLVLHGTEDEVVPFEQGRALAAAFPQRGAARAAGGGAEKGRGGPAVGGCTFVPLNGAGHNDMFDGRRMEEIIELIRSFALSS